MRRAHYLKRNHAIQIPPHCFFIDTETLPEEIAPGVERHSLNFGYACYVRRHRNGRWSAPDWLRFSTRGQLWDWIEARLFDKQSVTLFAHNWAFDAPVLGCFDDLINRGWRLRMAVIDSPPVILKYKRGSNVLKFIDTLNIWRTSLAKIGEHIGLEKLTMPAFDAPSTDWDRYGKRDVLILYRAVMGWFAFIERHRLGGFAPTLASQAMRAYRHRFMPNKIYIDLNQRALEIARESYVGGRVECFHIGKLRGEFYQLDINSQYPAHMRAEYYPTKLIGCYSWQPEKLLERGIEQYCVIAKVDIATDTPAYPVIENNTLLFPVGSFTVSLATPELTYALEQGHITKIHTIALYERARLFTQYVDYMYRLRRAAIARGDALESWLLKIMLNSLYGKFGQRGRIYTDIGTAPDLTIDSWVEVHAPTGDIFNYRQFAGVIQELQHDGESTESHPAIAAHVTSYARLGLWQLILQAGRENVFYCDTDCLVVNRQGFLNLEPHIDPNQLGALKIECAFSELHLFGPKDYQFGEKRRTKGVRNSARWVTPNEVEQERFSSLKGLIAKRDMSAPIVTTHRKRLRREYLKGTVTGTGSVTPLTLALNTRRSH